MLGLAGVAGLLSRGSLTFLLGLQFNVGDLMMTWSNDFWVSTPHRVANPPARIFWRKYGSSEEREFVETKIFDPAMRKDSGTYICQAENTIGLSEEEAVELDVLCKFPIS